MKVMALLGLVALTFSASHRGAVPVTAPGPSGAGSVSPPGDSGPLPVPAGLEPRIAFWIDIYTRYTTRQAVLHDEEYPQVIYGVIDLGEAPDEGPEFPDADEEIMEKARQRVAEIIRRQEQQEKSLAILSEEEQLVRDALALLPAEERGRRAAGRVRSQRGLQDRFLKGLIRSGRYLRRFRSIAREEGVPEDLAYLPHVESSFQGDARSHAGATGLWQFMRSTGRRYLTIDDVLDERFDPFLSAHAAFRYLHENYIALGSWPLAVTAYNHGLAGMRRAQKRFGQDLQAIIQSYRARSFGFASKNFYAEFLAARRIAHRPKEWFGKLRLDPPVQFRTLVLPEYALAGEFCRHFALDLDRLRRLNPALSASVWKGKRLLPRGYPLRLPVSEAERIARGWSNLPATARFSRQ
ncbi:MAG: lytic transglycosylase domain-containing protein, partial [Acidobacteriota bacterium]